ncbi:YfcL family protein [Shewanella maritima]|uniref:YfcL family protein n=1 Tax=Shewanella maritima TaxID=2520507 RepID=UPI0037364F0E
MLDKFDVTLESWIEEIVTNGDDDALFASGYLQGHVAVVLAELESESNHDIASMDEKMQHCLSLADEELESQDFQLVEQAWQQLRQRLVAVAA